VAGPGNILIKIGADAGQAVRELGTVNKSLGSTMTTSEKMAAGLRKAAVPAAAALTAIAIASKKAIDAASDLNEEISKAGVVFGSSGKDVIGWSKTLTKSFGISSTAALEAANVFGNMLVPMGFARKDAAKMSKTMVELAGDMASFNNASPEDTLEALRAGLAGESEPLRKYGVFLNDARLKQEALRQGLYSGKGALDAHAKAAATMALILKDTADAQGDFARTSDSAANQQRIMAAESANLTAELGQSLLPIYTDLQRIALKVVGVTAQHTTAVKVLVGVVAGLSAAILVANAALKAYAAAQALVKAATAAWTAAQWLLNAALNANPIGLIVVALAALAAGLVLAYTRSQTFRNIVTAAMSGVLAAVQAVGRAFNVLREAAAWAFNWITDHWRVAAFAFGPIGAALVVIVDNFDRIRSAASSAFNAIVGGINRAIEAVRSLIDWLSKIRVPKIKLPHIPGTRTAAGFGYSYALPAGRAAAGVAAAAPRAGGLHGGLTVNVYGAVDPEGTARAIRRILEAHDRRQGRRP
jgi:hypothetical protein